MPYNYLCVTSGVIIADIKEVKIILTNDKTLARKLFPSRLEIFLVGVTLADVQL